jgi:hypothetical protein
LSLGPIAGDLAVRVDPWLSLSALGFAIGKAAIRADGLVGFEAENLRDGIHDMSVAGVYVGVSVAGSPSA